jgi:hypothetical protein
MTIPWWASNEIIVNEYIRTIAREIQMGRLDIAGYRSEMAKRHGRFAEIICDLAKIKAEAPLLLGG